MHRNQVSHILLVAKRFTQECSSTDPPHLVHSYGFICQEMTACDGQCYLFIWSLISIITTTGIIYISDFNFKGGDGVRSGGKPHGYLQMSVTPLLEIWNQDPLFTILSACEEKSRLMSYKL